MQTKDITLIAIQEDDWFFLGGRLYRVLEKKVTEEGNFTFVELTFHNPHWMPSYHHFLKMDAGFSMQILNQ